MKDVPHVRQSTRKRNCAAACLSMIFQTYRKKASLKEITSNILIRMENGAFSCRNSLVIQYLDALKIPNCCVSVKDLRTFFPICKENNIDCMISFHLDLNAPFGHFCVAVDFDDSFVYLNDPQMDDPKGIRFPIRWDELIEKAKRSFIGSEIVQDNTVILLQNPKETIAKRTLVSVHEQLPSIPVFDAVLPCVKGILHAYCGQDGAWFLLKE